MLNKIKTLGKLKAKKVAKQYLVALDIGTENIKAFVTQTPNHKTKNYDVKLNDESSDFGWFSLDEVLNMKLYPGTKSFFIDVKAGRMKAVLQ